jgi:3-oxoacyl-[acyl-carrier protein] reductase
MRLDGKVAVITGAASGFGEGMAKRFAAEGAKIMVADINDNGSARVVGEITAEGGTAALVHCDVTSGSDVNDMIQKTVSDFGRVDILVNNAGYTHTRGTFLDVEEEEFDRIYNINVKSIFHAAKAVVPVMREQGSGVILNIASTAGVRPRPGLTWYNSSKGAVITMTKSMALELAGDGIRVVALNPVAGETPLLKEFMGGDTPENREMFISSIPLGRFSQPSDVAAAATFLCSDEGNFFTGVCLEVDGGRCI